MAGDKFTGNRRTRRRSAEWEKDKSSGQRVRIDATVMVFPPVKVVPWERPKQVYYKVGGSESDPGLVLGLVLGALDALGYKTQESRAAIIGEAVNHLSEKERAIAARVIVEGAGLQFELTEVEGEEGEQVSVVQPRVAHPYDVLTPKGSAAREVVVPGSGLWTPGQPIS